ncbi:DUF6445 family protein, partial [Ideonella sp.]|uniref:DUF6445 family protein n=1 Tax=Ideonella sp. TaxID=1929293 RepID=UPI003BB4ED98
MNLTAPPLPLFNPDARLSSVPLGGGQQCLVLDDALAEPERLVEWARTAAFAAPDGFPYPGRVVPAPYDLTSRLNDYFGQHLRSRLGGRRTLDAQARLSLVTTPPEALAPCQWLCHRDRIAEDPRKVLFAASVLYLFRDPALGGTSFYRPRRSPAETDQLVAASQLLTAA